MDVDIATERQVKLVIDHWKICAVKIELAREADAHEGYIEVWAVKCGKDEEGREILLKDAPKQIIFTGEDYFKFMDQQRLDLVSYIRDKGCLREE